MKAVGGFLVVWFMLAVAGIIGWIANVITIIHHVSDPITGMFVLRVLGIFAFPLGAVLGYF